jgi:hypothetical protein
MAQRAGHDLVVTVDASESISTRRLGRPRRRRSQGREPHIRHFVGVVGKVSHDVGATASDPGWQRLPGSKRALGAGDQIAATVDGAGE